MGSADMEILRYRQKMLTTLYSTSGYAPRGKTLFLKSRNVKTSPKIVINLPGPMRIYPVKENPIGSADSDILRYKNTDTQTDRHPVT